MTRLNYPIALLACFALLFAHVESATAETATVEEGLLAGDPIGPFSVTKVAGAEEDGVEAGESLCYRCRFGLKPMVMVFSRSTSNEVVKLVKQLDSLIESQQDADLKGLITLIGGDASELTTQAEAFAGLAESKHLPIVIAENSQDGPAGYRLNPATEVTVVIVNQAQVASRHDFAAKKIDLAAIKKAVNEMLE